jgi:hypothetical protein
MIPTRTGSALPFNSHDGPMLMLGISCSCKECPAALLCSVGCTYAFSTAQTRSAYRYARKKVLKETCTTGEDRDSVKYYMRCKHTSCPARKTVRVFIPGYDFVVQTVTEHNHAAGIEPPRLPAGQGTVPRKQHKSKSADVAYKPPAARSRAPQQADASQSSTPTPPLQADVLCQVLAAQLATLDGGPHGSGAGIMPASQADMLLNMLAVRPRLYHCWGVSCLSVAHAASVMLTLLLSNAAHVCLRQQHSCCGAT